MRTPRRRPRTRPVPRLWPGPILHLAAPIALALLVGAPLGAQTANVTSDRTLRWGDLRFHYELEPDRTDRIALTATVTNEGWNTVELRLPRCLAWLQVFRDGRRIWDRGQRESCAETVRFVHLEPGESERERYAVRARDLPGVSEDTTSVTVRAYLPGHRVPWLPPRATKDVRFGTLILTTGSRDGENASTPAFARTLGVPGLPWGTAAGEVRDRLVDRGFQTAGSDPNGSLLFNGHDFLGRNAGLIARLDEGRLVKLVAFMEPQDPSRGVRTDFREVRATLREFYGAPAHTAEDPKPRATWKRWSPGGLHAARLTVTSEGNLRLDLESPAWKRRYLEARAGTARR